MREIAVFVTSAALQIVLPWWIIRRDMQRLGPAALSRTWNEASFWAAVVAFGALSLPVHFLKSRRSMVGMLWGVAWMFGVLAVSVAVAHGLGPASDSK